uniref:uncharacterized protein LOC120329885 n=1 Tax=Styela clava TaxID=7725 RepID=UPI001939953A|nr:uncharacterized protein LOC120329885 [Styela clava]
MNIGFITLVWLVSLLRIAGCDDPKGHLQPLGSHMPPIKIDVIDTPPTPQEFFEKYIKVNKPVVIKGAAKVFSNFKTWQDDEYLKKKYGKWLAPVEVGKYEKKIVLIPFKVFLRNYNKHPICISRDIVPLNPMRDELSLMQSMSCGGYRERIVRVMFLLSSGSGQSALRWNNEENMHCMLDGTKNWTIIHRNDRHILPSHSQMPMYSAVDPRSVDMYKHPVMQDIHWYQAFVEAGDCLFVPNNSPYYVKSRDSRNLGFSVWFAAPRSLSLKDCPEKEADVPNSAPIGRSMISEVEFVKSIFYTMIDDRTDKVSSFDFHSSSKIPSMDIESRLLLFDILDLNDDDSISADEIESISDLSDSIWKDLIYDQDEYKELEEEKKTDETGKDKTEL